MVTERGYAPASGSLPKGSSEAAANPTGGWGYPQAHDSPFLLQSPLPSSNCRVLPPLSAQNILYIGGCTQPT
ncbi:hypothetical protein OG21DRAFT_1513305 [Imleria badia]|nr:hypothetical protein OG21DRAFT_1513305 [Imleria badia]